MFFFPGSVFFLAKLLGETWKKFLDNAILSLFSVIVHLSESLWTANSTSQYLSNSLALYMCLFPAFLSYFLKKENKCYCCTLRWSRKECWEFRQQTSPHGVIQGSFQIKSHLHQLTSSTKIDTVLRAAKINSCCFLFTDWKVFFSPSPCGLNESYSCHQWQHGLRLLITSA